MPDIGPFLNLQNETVNDDSEMNYFSSGNPSYFEILWKKGSCAIKTRIATIIALQLFLAFFPVFGSGK
jgi:hypothetical protein